jgi:hypothetical protein
MHAQKISAKTEKNCKKGLQNSEITDILSTSSAKTEQFNTKERRQNK